MATATVRISADKRDILKSIARTENTSMKEILSELIDEYAQRHQETIDLLARPEWADAIARGEAEVALSVPGRGLDELPDRATRASAGPGNSLQPTVPQPQAVDTPNAGA